MTQIGTVVDTKARSAQRSVNLPRHTHSKLARSTNTQVARQSPRTRQGQSLSLPARRQVCRHRCRLAAVVRDALAKASVTRCRQAHDGWSGESRDRRRARVLFITASPKVLRATNACEGVASSVCSNVKFVLQTREVCFRSSQRRFKNGNPKVRAEPLPNSTGMRSQVHAGLLSSRESALVNRVRRRILGGQAESTVRRLHASGFSGCRGRSGLVTDRGDWR